MPDPPTAPLLTLTELAHYLGCHRNTVLKARKEGRLPDPVIGGKFSLPAVNVAIFGVEHLTEKYYERLDRIGAALDILLTHGDNGGERA